MLHGITVREQYNKNSFLGKDILYRNTSFFLTLILQLYTKLLNEYSNRDDYYYKLYYYKLPITKDLLS